MQRQLVLAVQIEEDVEGLGCEGSVGMDGVPEVGRVQHRCLRHLAVVNKVPPAPKPLILKP